MVCPPRRGGPIWVGFSQGVGGRGTHLYHLQAPTQVVKNGGLTPCGQQNHDPQRHPNSCPVPPSLGSTRNGPDSHKRG